MNVFLDILSEAAFDTLRLLPFLYLTYLLMEYLEDKAQPKTIEFVKRTGRFGPLAGSLVGIIPQCGFSAAASSLYAGGVITVGTLLASFLSTSDEMLPIFISEAVPVGTIVKVLLTKVMIAMISGFALDFVNRQLSKKRKDKRERHIHDLCEQDHCHCEEGNIFLSALVHTIQIALFIFLISIVIGILVETVGLETIAGFLNNRPITGVLLAGLVGLIPNCAASVMLTEFYLKGVLGPGQMMAGLLVSAGVGLLVLFRTHRIVKKNIQIMAVLYLTGVFWGFLINMLGITF
ncbi:MAG: arsenic efflux protein [Eubacterium sp.]|nr:arsenic efflux protein [Eubacterium sp.]